MRIQSLWVLAAAAALVGCAGERSITGTPPDGTSDSTSTPVPVPQPGAHAGFYASPSGSSAGDGTAAHPWDLTTALANASGKIQPGDTVWMRAGTYTGDFRTAIAGTASRPIVFRQYPGERATIDGTIRADGADVWFWGFEVMRSAPTGRLPAVESRGARQKFINLIIHDAAQQGITFWDEAVDAELYGNIVYNNGTHENLDHGTYVHNVTGTKLIDDNIFFNNLAYGIHVYVSPGQGAQKNVHVVGNVSFNNGTISNSYAAKGNILIGGEDPGQGHQAIDNLLYFSGTDGVNLQLGYTASNQDIVCKGNTVWGGATAFMIRNWTAAVVQGNTIGGSSDIVDFGDSPDGYSWSGNTYYRATSAAAWRDVSGTDRTLADWQRTTGLGSSDQIASDVPASTKVFVKANKYEPGRALVVVYNWGHNGSINADLSGVLRNGQQYEVRNVQDMFGPAVASGTYSGGGITLPMTGVNPPARIGRSTPTPPKTGPNFDVFEVIPK